MRNEVIYDKNGRPDIMVVFTPSELGLPDTLRGRKVKEYAISKYPNTLIDGVPYSLPFMKPAVNISHDEAIRLCESKGEGWHLITTSGWLSASGAGTTTPCRPEILRAAKATATQNRPALHTKEAAARR